MVTDPLFLAYLAQFDDDAWLRAVDRLAGCDPSGGPGGDPRLVPLLSLAAPAGARDLFRARGPGRPLCVSRDAGGWRISVRRRTGSCSAIATGPMCESGGAERATSGAPGQPRPGGAGAGDRERTSPPNGASTHSWVVGITAVALRTLRQVGLPAVTEEALSSGPFIGAAETNPDRLVERRRRRSHRWLGFLKGRLQPSAITFDERPPAAIVSLDRLAAPDHCRRPSTGATTGARIPGAARDPFPCSVARAPAARAGWGSSRARSACPRSRIASARPSHHSGICRATRLIPSYGWPAWRRRSARSPWRFPRGTARSAPASRRFALARRMAYS